MRHRVNESPIPDVIDPAGPFEAPQELDEVKLKAAALLAVLGVSPGDRVRAALPMGGCARPRQGSVALDTGPGLIRPPPLEK